MMYPRRAYPQARTNDEALIAVLTDYATRQTQAAGECQLQQRFTRDWVLERLELEIAP